MAEISLLENGPIGGIYLAEVHFLDAELEWVTMDVTNESSEVKLDGRRQRGEQNRQAIIDAALALIAEGCLAPTAQLISERAGITIRSLFRHFPDMESLFAAANTEVRSRAVGTFTGGDHQGSLEERARLALKRYCDGYQQEQNLILMTKAQSWRYKVLRENYASLQEDLRRNLEAWIPEIRKSSDSELEFLHAVTSFEMWHRLRENQGLSQTEVVEIMVDELVNRLS